MDKKRKYVEAELKLAINALNKSCENNGCIHLQEEAAEILVTVAHDVPGAISESQKKAVRRKIEKIVFQD